MSRCKKGDYWQIDDFTGEQVLASTTTKQWNGYVTNDPDIRNPQEYQVRGIPDDQRVPLPRPEAEDYFLSVNEVTRDDL